VTFKNNDVGIEDRIAIQDGITIGIRFRKRLSQLLHDPVGRQVSCDVKVDPAASVLDYEMAIQHSERRRWHGKQVQADDGFAVIAKKRKPLSCPDRPAASIRCKYRATTLLSETAKPSF
jgi:hypothetical protein